MQSVSGEKNTAVVFKCSCGHRFADSCDADLGTKAECPACTGEAVCAVRIATDYPRKTFEQYLEEMSPRDAGFMLLASALSALGMTVIPGQRWPERKPTPKIDPNQLASSLYGNYVDQAVRNCSETTTIRVLKHFTYELSDRDGDWFFTYDWPQDGTGGFTEGPFNTRVEALAGAIAHMRECIPDDLIWDAYQQNLN